jgi:hypothetical protein
MDLLEESPLPQLTNSLVVIDHAHTQNMPAFTVVELVNPVEAGALLVMSPTNEEQKMVTKVPAQSVAEKLPLVTCAEPRRGIKLKVKGTHSSFD